MNYLLSKEELDDLSADRKKIEAEFESKLSIAKTEMASQIMQLCKGRGYDNNAGGRNPELYIFTKSVMEVMEKVKISSQPEKRDLVVTADFEHFERVPALRGAR